MQHLRQPRAVQLPRRHIDGYVHVLETAAVQRRHLDECIASDPLHQIIEQCRILDAGEEIVGKHRAAFLVPTAQQGFEAHYATRADVDLRL